MGCCENRSISLENKAAIAMKFDLPHAMQGGQPATAWSLFALLALIHCDESHAQLPASQPPISLEQRLVAGLQARRPSELVYIEAVVDTVNRGDLPQRLVDRLFFWARSRGSHHRPIIYFQPGLDRVAARLKITIEPDDPLPTLQPGPFGRLGR